MASFNKNFRVKENLDVLGTGVSTFAGPLTVTGTVTGTTFAGSGASLTNIPNAALTNSSVTIGSSAVALGAALTTIVGLTSVTSTTFVGSLTGSASQLNSQAASYYLDLTNATGTLNVARLPALTGGDVTSSAGSSTLTIGTATVSLAKMANLAANSIIGNNTGSAAVPLALTAAQVRTLLNVADGATANTGTVTAVSVVTANGVSGSSSGGATPALTLTLGAITPTSVAASGAVTGSNLSGTNTGDQTTISGNAGSATILATARNIGFGTGPITATAQSFNGSAAISIPITSFNLADATMSGILGTDHLGTGTANSTTFLRGDGTWQVVAASGGITWTTINSGNVATAATNTGYIMETGGTTRTVTLPASVAAGFNISVNASGGSVRIVSNGNVIDTVGAGNDLLLADGNTASLVAKSTGNLEIIYGGTTTPGNVPAGGSTGYVLTKNSATDYDYSWAVAGGGGVTDGDKGDIVVSGTGATWTIDTASVTLAKMANMATASFLGRNTAATGVPEVLSVATAKTMLALTSGDVGLGNVENTALSTWAGSSNITTIGNASGVTQSVGDNTTKVATTSFVQHARDPRVQTVAAGATVTPAGDTEDMVVVTAQNAAMVLANPTGTPVQGQKLIVRVKDNGTARGLSYGSLYRALGNALPTTTVISKTLYMGFMYNSTDTKWDLIAVAQEA